MNIIEAIGKVKNTKIYMRRKSNRQKKYYYSYGELYAYDNKINQYLVDGVNNIVSKLSLKDEIVEELQLLKEFVKTDYKNSWYRVDKLYLETILADDWELV